MTDQLLGVRDRPDRLRGVGVFGAAVALDYLNVGTAEAAANHIRGL